MVLFTSSPFCAAESSLRPLKDCVVFEHTGVSFRFSISNFLASSEVSQYSLSELIFTQIMAEIFGTIAAAVTLGPVILKLGRELRDGARSVKFARRELEELVNEMSIFTALTYEFYNACSTKKKQTELVLSAQERLADWTEAAIQDFEQLSYTVDALSTDPIYQHTAYQVARAHYDWYRSKSYLEYLRASLSVARQSMNGFTNVCNMELLDEQLVYLKSVLTTQQRKEIEQEFGMPVEKRIKVIQSIRYS